MPVQEIRLTLDSVLRSRLESLAVTRKETLDHILHEAAEQYATREEKRRDFLDSGVQAWALYQQTGLHVTDTEADVWLAQLESGTDLKPPSCHV